MMAEDLLGEVLQSWKSPQKTPKTYVLLIRWEQSALVFFLLYLTADHSASISAEIKKMRIYKFPHPNISSWCSVQLIEYRDNSRDQRYNFPQITVAARSGAWTVFARSNTEIMGSNQTGGMDVCVRLFCFCVVLCVGSGLGTGWSPVQGVLLTVYRIRKTEKDAKAQQNGCRAY
jgi:hypothetical protein